MIEKRYNMFFLPFYKQMRLALRTYAKRWLSLDGLKAMLSVAPATELGEQDQSKIRVAIAASVLGFLLWYVLYNHTEKIDVLVVAVGFFSFAIAWMIHLRTASQVSVARRILGLIVYNP